MDYYHRDATGILTTFSNVPQVLKCWRTGNTKDLSTEMLLALSAEHPVGYTRRLGGKQLRFIKHWSFSLAPAASAAIVPRGVCGRAVGSN